MHKDMADGVAESVVSVLGALGGLKTVAGSMCFMKRI